jgi:DNA polymerase
MQPGPRDRSSDARRELGALVAAFRARLEWSESHGIATVGAAPSPRGLRAPEGQAASGTAPEQEHVADVIEAARPDPEESVDGSQRLARLRQELGDCQRCRLSAGRRHLVFGAGSPEAEVMFIGEAPGQEEDQQGEPFVGAAGQLLTKMIEAMGLRRDEVYIANIIKCRPPQNRDPAPDEVDACEPFLRRQIESIGPRMVIAMGNFAAKTLLRTETGITRLRGRFFTYHGIPLMPTFHPAYLLRNPDGKRPAWQDLKAVMAEMDRLGLKRRR